MRTPTKIQSGTPKPKVNRAPKNPHRVFPVRDMAVDDWFFLPHRKARPVSAYLSRVARELPGTFAAMRVHARQETLDWKLCEPTDVGANEGVGVWRTK